jgi:hypothetical protein
MYPLVLAKSAGEFWYLRDALFGRGLLVGAPTNVLGECVITPEGWSYLAEIAHRTPRSDKAFVAMWFAPEMDAAWEQGFRPTLDALGYRPMRVDREHHSGKIDDFIVANIRTSGLVVADFTGHRGGVYFEAGFALGLNLPYVFTCHANDIGNAHFDTRQYNHIVWNEPGALGKKLRERIEAVVLNRPRPRVEA